MQKIVKYHFINGPYKGTKLSAEIKIQ